MKIVLSRKNRENRNNHVPMRDFSNSGYNMGHLNASGHQSAEMAAAGLFDPSATNAITLVNTGSDAFLMEPPAISVDEKTASLGT